MTLRQTCTNAEWGYILRYFRPVTEKSGRELFEPRLYVYRGTDLHNMFEAHGARWVGAAYAFEVKLAGPEFVRLIKACEVVGLLVCPPES